MVLVLGRLRLEVHRQQLEQACVLDPGLKLRMLHWRIRRNRMSLHKSCMSSMLRKSCKSHMMADRLVRSMKVCNRLALVCGT